MIDILVAIDGSKNALRAVDYAIAQAKRLRARVHLLNVQPLLDDYGTVRAYLSRQRHRELMMQRAKAILKPAVERLRRARIAHDVHTVYDDIAPAIARASRRLKCESIVMGTRGMGAIGNLFLGSVATRVIHLTRIPVTLVK